MPVNAGRARPPRRPSLMPRLFPSKWLSQMAASPSFSCATLTTARTDSQPISPEVTLILRWAGSVRRSVRANLRGRTSPFPNAPTPALWGPAPETLPSAPGLSYFQGALDRRQPPLRLHSRQRAATKILHCTDIPTIEELGAIRCSMLPVLILTLSALTIGFILGYGTRSAVSAYRHTHARRRRAW